MLNRLKINIAVIICLAFLFRLFSFSIGYLSFSSEQQVSNSFYTVKNSQTQIDPLQKSEIPYSDIEFSEEDSDDDNELKFHASFLLELFYVPVQHKLIKQVPVITPTNKYFTSSSFQRHLEFGVFRI